MHMICNAKLGARLRLWQVLFRLSLGASLLAGSSAMADVIEVGSNGTAIVYSGPTLFVGNRAQPLVRPTTPQANLATKTQPAALKLVEPAYPLRLHPVLDAYVSEAAQLYGVDPVLVRAVAWQESRFSPAALSPKGAIGLMQLMPATAAGLGVDPYDPRGNIFGGVAYLALLLQRFDGDIVLALAAYNAGPEAVARYGGIPPYRETKNYVKAISERLAIRPPE